ncbi:nucleotidyltransferase domain-containing protein [Candidatus Collierbacteria bacterium]|nr:nucleotidyltransferase domain-containing protein [Candidatus Collierbacteria bacterium]
MKLNLGQKQKIVDYFKRQPKVSGVYLYGSQAEDKAGPLSDIDVAVLMSNKVAKDDYPDLQLKFISGIQSIVNVDLAADVKILNEDYALLYQASVINQGELVVNNQPKEVERFVHRVGMLFPDFYPVLQRYYFQMNQRLEKGIYAA